MIKLQKIADSCKDKETQAKLNRYIRSFTAIGDSLTATQIVKAYELINSNMAAFVADKWEVISDKIELGLYDFNTVIITNDVLYTIIKNNISYGIMSDFQDYKLNKGRYNLRNYMRFERGNYDVKS